MEDVCPICSGPLMMITIELEDQRRMDALICPHCGEGHFDPDANPTKRALGAKFLTIMEETWPAPEDGVEVTEDDVKMDVDLVEVEDVFDALRALEGMGPFEWHNDTFLSDVDGCLDPYSGERTYKHVELNGFTSNELDYIADNLKGAN